MSMRDRHVVKVDVEGRNQAELEANAIAKGRDYFGPYRALRIAAPYKATDRRFYGPKYGDGREFYAEVLVGVTEPHRHAVERALSDLPVKVGWMLGDYRDRLLRRCPECHRPLSGGHKLDCEAGRG